MQHWIWPDAERYPHHQTTKYSAFLPGAESYAVMEFIREYSFSKPVHHVVLTVSADTEFRLLCNGVLLATGPANVGGDFMANEALRPNYYATEIVHHPTENVLRFYARVKMMPVYINEYSHGRGGFFLSVRVCFRDGSETVVGTDSSWLCRRNGAYVAPCRYDGTVSADPYEPAAEIEDVWHPTVAPIPPRTEEVTEVCELRIPPHGERAEVFDFDRIYAGFLGLSVKTNGLLTGDVGCYETVERGSREDFRFGEDTEYVGLQLHSIGGLRVSFRNEGDEEAVIRFSVIATAYPVKSCAAVTTSDGELDRVLAVCRHSLRYCRQMIHLDSPRHCEPLACTGDYYIETLMTAFSYGDMSLARFDLVRTAELLRQQDGVMFHTTYSMIWVLMLYDVYRLTGDRALLSETADALGLLLRRFRTYLGENGLIETPPSYMFIDWLYLDGISLHHPPKALGQTCLNLFYYGGLTTAALIYGALGEEALADRCRTEAESLKAAINGLLYDEERGLYCEGLNTPTPEALLHQYMPQNVEKRYFRRHANVLAVYFGACEDPRALLTRTLEDDSLGDYQPYFAHFVLEAVLRAGLREDYTLPLLNRWKAPVRECGKGLPEGFIPPEPTYQFDHSHAWGGTPLYALPMALTGLEICEAGFRRIRLSPSLLGLSHAVVEIPTPMGTVRVEQAEGEMPRIFVPDGIEWNRKDYTI